MVKPCLGEASLKERELNIKTYNALVRPGRLRYLNKTKVKFNAFDFQSVNALQ